MTALELITVNPQIRHVPASVLNFCFVSKFTIQSGLGVKYTATKREIVWKIAPTADLLVKHWLHWGFSLTQSKITQTVFILKEFCPQLLEKQILGVHVHVHVPVHCDDDLITLLKVCSQNIFV